MENNTLLVKLMETVSNGNSILGVLDQGDIKVSSRANLFCDR